MKEKADSWIKENSKWIVWVLLVGIALWAWNDGKVLTWELQAYWIVGALGLLGYMFLMIKKDLYVLRDKLAVQEVSSQVVLPTKEDFSMGTPFSLDTRRGK